MITECAKPDYSLPDDFFEVRRLTLEAGRHHIAIAMISDTQMQKMHLEHPTTLGMPMYASVYDERLWLYPTPDGAYSLEAVYQPPPKVF